MTPRISVLMGIYNCAPTLPAALDSLYAQTYSRFRLILCDDGSTDDTREVAARYAERYDNILLLTNDRNRGLNYTLNRCLAQADTEYVARMDGDDISLPTRFEEEVNFLDEHSDYAVVSTAMEYFDEQGPFRTGRGRGEIHKENFLHGSPISHPACMARTEAFRSVGGYSESPRLLRVEDYHLWFKLFAAGHKIYVLDRVLYRFRDDRNAVARRTWRNRLNQHYVMRRGFKMIGLPRYYAVYSLRPLIIGLLPRWLYLWLHRRR